MILELISQEGYGLIFHALVLVLGLIFSKNTSFHRTYSILGVVLFFGLSIANSTQSPLESAWRMSTLAFVMGCALLLYVSFLMELTHRAKPVFFPVFYVLPVVGSIFLQIFPSVLPFLGVAIMLYSFLCVHSLTILVWWRRDAADEHSRRDAEWFIMIHIVFLVGLLISIIRLFNWFTWLIAFWYFVLFIVLTVLRIYEQPTSWENRLILDNILDLVIIVDSRGKISKVNRRTCALTGYAPETLLGMHIETLLMHAELTRENRLEWLSVNSCDDVITRNNRSPSIDASIISSSGDGFPVDLRIIALPRIQRQGDSWIIVATDMRITRQLIKEISDREYAARDLALSESKFSRMFIFNPAGILILDVYSLEITEVNPSVEEIFDTEAVLLIGKRLTEIGLDMGTIGLESFLETLVIEGSVPEFEAHIDTSGGKRKTCRVSAVIFDLNSSQSMLLSLTDVTREEHMREALLRKQKMETIGLLAGGIAHDFNNILAVILGYLGIARRKATESQLKPLAKAEDACLRAREITGQLLAFSRGGKPVIGVCDTGKLLSDAVSMIITNSLVECVFDIEDSVWNILADRIQAGQVVSNLAVNAVEAMNGKGRLTIRAVNRDFRNTPVSLLPLGSESRPVARGQYVEIRIEDNGPGIPDSIRDRVFDPFFTTKESGTGLGLSIVYSVMQNHAGAVTLVSPPGGGAVFVLWFPASEGTIQSVSRSGVPTLPANQRVLVLDDDDAVRHSARDMLESFTYQVTSATTGDEAVLAWAGALADGKPFDFGILDLVIPGALSGSEAAKKILEIDPGARLIVSSGYSDDPVLSCYREYGFTGLLPKPYTPEEMMKAIMDVLV